MSAGPAGGLRSRENRNQKETHRQTIPNGSRLVFIERHDRICIRSPVAEHNRLAVDFFFLFVYAFPPRSDRGRVSVLSAYAAAGVTDDTAAVASVQRPFVTPSPTGIHPAVYLLLFIYYYYLFIIIYLLCNRAGSVSLVFLFVIRNLYAPRTRVPPVFVYGDARTTGKIRLGTHVPAPRTVPLHGTVAAAAEVRVSPSWPSWPRARARART